MSMLQRKLRQTGVSVGAIGLGCSSLSLIGRPTEADAISAIHMALDQGVTLFDTADV